MRILALLSALFVSLGAWQAQGAALLDITQNGAQMFNNPDVSILASSPTSVVGNQLRLSPDGVGNTLLRWNLLDPDSYDDLTIDLAIDYVPRTTDNDFFFALGNSTGVVGLQRADNNGGQLRLGGEGFSGLSLLGTGLGGVDTIMLRLVIDAGTGAVTASGSEGAFSFGDILTPAVIDVTQGLHLQFNGNDSGEEYGVNLVSITVNGTVTAVPLPAALPLMLSGLAVIGLLRRRRQANSGFGSTHPS